MAGGEGRRLQWPKGRKSSKNEAVDQAEEEMERRTRGRGREMRVNGRESSRSVTGGRSKGDSRQQQLDNQALSRRGVSEG